MELQSNIAALTTNGIAIFAISYDPVETLASFAAAHAITYPLLSDAGSVFIDQLGIRNTTVDPTSRGWGIPYPGTYFIGENGHVTDKTFHDGHRTRDAAATALHEHFGIETSTSGSSERQETEAFTAVAAFDSDSFVRGERVGLRVILALRPGTHLCGRPLPEGYIPTTLTVTVPEPMTAEPVQYPPAHPMRMAWLDEQLSVHEGTITLVTAVVFTDWQEDVTITATLDVQACTTVECFVPQTLTFTLPMRFRAFPQ